MVNLWVRVMHGIESTEESAAWFIDYCRTNHGLLAIRADNHTGGQYLRLPGGIFNHLFAWEQQECANAMTRCTADSRRPCQPRRPRKHLPFIPSPFRYGHEVLR